MLRSRLGLVLRSLEPRQSGNKSCNWHETLAKIQTLKRQEKRILLVHRYSMIAYKSQLKKKKDQMQYSHRTGMFCPAVPLMSHEGCGR